MTKPLLPIMLAFLAWVATTSTHAAAQTNDKPNILFIYIDDMGWRDPSYMGSDYFETPNIDKLAKKGTIFTNAYSCAANCAPARASLLSGQYTPRHKIYNVGTRPRGKAKDRLLTHVPGTDTLSPSIKTWAHQLKSAGYTTATMGKWHLSKDPIPYGFDINIGGTHSGGPPRGYYPPHPKVPGLKTDNSDEYLTDRLSEEACRFIEKNQEQPWMLYLTHFAVHTPIQAKKDLLPKYKNKPKGSLHNNPAMGTMIQSVDDGVGKIVETLKRLKLDRNTVIFFYSDNGGYGPATDMKPLKGYKGTYYEGGIRVPFFAHWPGKIPAGKTVETPIIGTDLYPTFCAIAKAKLPPNQKLDGLNLLPLLLGKEKLKERDLFWFFPAYLQSYRGVKNEQRDPKFRSRPCSIIRSGKWKLHYYFEDRGIELYDLSKDVSESKNVVSENSVVMKNLIQRLRAWEKETGADIPVLKNGPRK